MRNLTLKEMVGEKDFVKRCYSVKGQIVVIYPSDPFPEKNGFYKYKEVRDLLRKIQWNLPWKDDGPFESQESRNAFECVEDGISGPAPIFEKGYYLTFKLAPYHNRLRRGQIWAYGKYLENLAKELAKSDFLVGASGVKFFYEITTVESIKLAAH